jgi:glycosyltransferase involved in cell wall biosynthesis
MPHPLVTVLTPVFNGETYLTQCIEAVLAQTYKHFEYVIVDNCSTDESLAIALKFAHSDSRVRVIKNDVFLSQRANLNHALQFVSTASSYCKFAFADDLLLPRCLEEMVAVAETNPDVALVGAYRSYGQDIGCIGIPFGTAVVTGSQACRLYLEDGHNVFGSQNCVLYRLADLTRKMPNVFAWDYFGDTDLCFDLLRSRSFGFVHQVLTYTRMDNHSVWTEVQPFNAVLLALVLFLHQYGNHYLDPDDFASLWKQKWRQYRLFMGKSLLRRRGKAFWEFHHKALASVGLTIGAGEVRWNAALAVIDLLLNPKASIGRLIEVVKRYRRLSRIHGIQVSGNS